MSEVTASCPGCGANLVYQYAGLVVVCEQCRSAVARGDVRFEDLGKVSQITPSQSALRLGLGGTYQNTPFAVCGRVQRKHSAGGGWDEWYAAFFDGRWGWLAEAQGKLYLTFQAPPQALPAFSHLSPGGGVALAGTSGNFVIEEKGEAELLGAEGEIPYRVQPGARYPFADFSGPEGEYGTIDYQDETPTLYLGREVTLEELGINAAVLPPPPVAPTVTGNRIACPNCGASLDLRAPDRAERVSCQYCASLLDVNQGALVFLKTLSRTGPSPRIELGKTGKLQGKDWTVIGFVVRSVTVEGERYSWEEYLIFRAPNTFQWLIYNEGHWISAKTIPAGQVSTSGDYARYRGKSYELSETNTARVDFVLGEFYWKVEVGETVQVSDFIKKPNVLSRELSGAEVVWSYGTYTASGMVERAFGLAVPPKPVTKMPYQPSSSYKPSSRKSASFSSGEWGWLVFVAMIIIIPILIGTCSACYDDDYDDDDAYGSVYVGSGFRGGK